LQKPSRAFSPVLLEKFSSCLTPSLRGLRDQFHGQKEPITE
jgi:hypothetical protein